MKLVRKLTALTMCLMLMGTFMTGCAAFQISKDNPVKGPYYVARATFNDALESYITQRPGLSEDTKLKIEPLFFEGSTALDMWGLALQSKDMNVYEKELAYKTIKTELFKALFKYGVLEVK